MPIGVELREARERAALSIEQIAEHTKLKPQRLEALENSDFANLPEGIYLDGIVRAYTKEVGLDPEPFIARTRYERATMMDVLAPVRETALKGCATVDRAGWAANDRAGYAIDNTPPYRRAVLALPLACALAVAGWSAYFVESVREPNVNAGKSTTVEITETKPRADGPASQRTPVAVQPSQSPRTVINPATPNVSGVWSLATHVESASYAAFTGLQLGYEILLKQAGDRIIGVGRKVVENGGGIDSRAQTPISLDGTINGDRVELTFTERGARRSTRGQFVLMLDDEGALRGSFVSSAAASSGSVEARRLR